jgi:glycosyltransferase involved in cell wall biosynthesis
VFSFHTLYGEFVKKYHLLKPLSMLLWWLMKEYHNRADVNITVSSIMQEDLAKRGFRRVRYWPPAVDSRLFHPRSRSEEMRARLAGAHAGKNLLLTVSRLAPEKNVAFLADVLDQCPDACLAIVGDGPQRPELERRFACKNANFLGYLKGAELAAAYASADAFVYASEMETMGNVVLEAMASGCALVAPRAGGIPSLVNHGETGLLYAPGDLEEAVRYTRLLLSDDPSRARLGQAAREWVEGWDWSHSINQVREIYKESIDQYQRAARRRTYRQGLAQLVMSALVSGFKSVGPPRDRVKKGKVEKNGRRSPALASR